MKELHVQRFPYNDFLYPSEEEVAQMCAADTPDENPSPEAPKDDDSL